MDDDKMVSLELLPVTLNPDRDDFVNGWPAPADEKTSKEIFDCLNRVSAVYGTKFELGEDNIIRVVL